MSSDLPSNKKTKIKRALKSAARIPRVPAIKGSRMMGRSSFSPRPGEPPVVLLRLQVLGCTNLLSKDRSGTSDPFVVVSVLNKKEQTPVAKKTLNPTFPEKDATFDFPLYLSLADRLGVVELVVWDKDMIKKDYLGEVSVPLEDWFRGKDEYAFDSPENKPFTLNLVSTRTNTPSSGTIQVKLGFAPTPNSHNLMEYDEIYGELVKRSRPSLVSAPPTEGVGTIRAHPDAYYHDDGGLSSDEEDEESDAEGLDSDTTPPPSHSPSPSPKPLLDIFIPPTTEIDLMPSTSSDPTPQPPEAQKVPQGPAKPPFRLPPELNILPSSPATPTPGNLPTAVPRRVVSEGQGHAEPAEETPKASAGFSLPAPQPAYPSSTSSSSRFIPNPKKFVRKISGLTAGINAPSSPAVDSQGNLVPPSPISPKTTTSARSASRERRKFGRSWSGYSSGNGSVSPSGSGSDVGGLATPEAGATPSERHAKRMKRRKKEVGYEFKGSNDIVGIVMLEIQGAEDLPKISNRTRIGWDMDPFVVISFGKKVFRTRVIRHSLNPTWDEKLLFHVRRYETAYKVQLTVLDWDKLTSNDHVGEASFNVKEVMEGGIQPDPETGLYKFDLNDEEEREEGMKEFKLPLETNKNVAWEARHSPTIKFRAKYQPYDALRQRFWRQYLQQYDSDNTNTISHLELTAMLDSLGSTLTRSTLASFFTRFNKNPKEDELTIDEAVMCLEAELGRPVEEKRRLDEDTKEGEDGSVSATPVMMVAGEKGEEVQLDWGRMDFSGPPHVGLPTDAADAMGVGAFTTEPMQLPLHQAAAAHSSDVETPDLSSDDNGESGNNSPTMPLTPGGSLAPSAAGSRKKYRRNPFRRNSRKTSTNSEPATPTAEESPSPESPPSASVERVINVKNCPLCHRPRMNSKAEIDIITHLAICASEDWNKVDKIMVGNFVTASQAQRKWYTKVIGRVGKGDYRLGANSANIIVQNRMTGQLEEEKMQVYVRLGIRLLYKGASSRMEGARARRLLKSMSIKQGIKYDDPESAKDIPTFIQFHGLNVDEILDPIDSFKTFNQFFYRKLKPSARPVECPDDPYRIVSAADCRLMTFESVSEATKLWIKGREFTVARLLGDTYKDEAHKYAGGALAIFRLAPQDYHRFHSPVDGTIGKMTYIAGEYYTVNPQAIRTALDVYGENARKIVPIDSPQFGRVMAVCVGAMMVGSIITTVEEGESVRRGQEFGYFAFGGSTIVMLFEKGRVEWDEDLLINGRASLETLVRVGMGIGRGRPGANTPMVDN